MSPKQIILIAVAGIAALVSGLLITMILSNQEPAAPPPPPPETVRVVETREVAEVQVLVADRQIRVGEEITGGDMRWANWPKSGLSADLITQEDEPNAMERLEGRLSRTPIFEGEPLVAARLVDRGAAGILSARLERGYRAVAIEIGDESFAAGGFILPDDRVDVILAYDMNVVENGYTETRAATSVVIENVRVLAVDQVMRQDDVGGEIMMGRTATLEVTPEQAELLILARRMGEMSLVLRSIEDVMAFDGEPSIGVDLGNGPAGSEIQVYKNGEASNASGS